ncbi:MAG: hypothetical protein H7Y20_19290 [Bryobacteraceae bacterium]|nr:hypothetical protein [Bryobacteraceae bacterium]
MARDPGGIRTEHIYDMATTRQLDLLPRGRSQDTAKFPVITLCAVSDVAYFWLILRIVAPQTSAGTDDFRRYWGR